MPIEKSLRATYDEALARIPDALRQEGFGVLTRIDLHTTLEQKLGVHFRRYTILGACNPPFAQAALETTLKAGVMMPCNVVVYEGDDGRAVVLAVDPTAAAATLDSRLSDLARSVQQRLGQALARLE